MGQRAEVRVKNQTKAIFATDQGGSTYYDKGGKINDLSRLFIIQSAVIRVKGSLVF
jgi:hypothetical protein